MRVGSFLSLFVACILGTACARHLPPVASMPPTNAPHVAASLEVGTARADVTMPPGASTFGHGPDARIAEGFWTRTYCRVFYFETPERKLALVPCELPAMGALLQRRVAEKVSKRLHPSQLMITAVHTHAGVGHYFGASQYTGIFSSRLPGYDGALMEAIATRVADAIEEAVMRKRPAKLSWGFREDFWCHTRNRSLDAYRLNGSNAYAPPVPASAECTKDHPERAAIDPNMHVLRIDSLDPTLGPLGSISFFAMHPTVVHNTNQLFGADTAGVISRYVERELRRAWCPTDAPCSEARVDPLHGVVNTNEGDISPIWSAGHIDEAIAVGTEVGQFVWSAHPSADKGKGSVVFDTRYVEENIRGAKISEQGGSFQTCDYPEIGMGAARGANDHPTSVAFIPWFSSDPPTDFGRTDCQAPKVPMLGVLSETTKPPGAFPSDLPLAVAQIDDVMISFVPAEMTVTAGFRLNQRVLARTAGFAGAPTRAVIAGLSNEYIQYITTEEEYPNQDYEGASTLYGPNSSRYFTNRFGLLAASMFDPKAADELGKLKLEFGAAKRITVNYGPAVHALATPTGDRAERKHVATCTMPAPQMPPRFCTYWLDDGPGDVELHDQPWITLVRDDAPRSPLRICAAGTAEPRQCDSWGFVDDRGDEFRTRIHDKVNGAWAWSTLFSPSLRTWREIAGTRVRIRVGKRLPSVESQAFAADSLPQECKPAQARLCTAGARTEEWKDLIPRSD